MNFHQPQRSIIVCRLIWLLIVAEALLGFTTSRLQVLGPLHHHVNPGLREESLLASAATFLLKSWRDRRRQQEMFGHDHLALPGAALSSSQNAFEGLDDERVEPNGVHTHQHGELERHHHAIGDASVLALDSAGMGADAMDGGTSSSLLFLSDLVIQVQGLTTVIWALFREAWPTETANRFSSWDEAPPVRPPSR